MTSKEERQPARPDEQVLRWVFDRMPDAYLRFDLRGGLVLANPAAARLFGYDSTDEMTGLPAASLYTDAGERPAVLNRLRESGRVAEHVSRARRKDGSTFWASIDARDFHDEQGLVAGTEGFVRDITERKGAEETLRATLARLETSLSLVEATLESTESGILVVTLAGDIVKANRRFAEMWGVPGDVLAAGHQGLLDRVLIQLSNPDEFVAKVNALYADPRADSADLVRFKDGRIFERLSKPMFVGGEPTARIWCFFDITDRTRADEALRASEERFQKAFNHSPDAININRLRDGLYVEVNSGFLALTGYAREEVLGRTSLDLGIWADPIDRDRLVRGLASDGEVSNLEARFVGKDGSEHVALMSASIIQLDGEPHILSMTRDITERKQAETALRESNELLSLFIRNSLIYVFIKEVTPTQSRVLMASENFQEMVGIPGSAMVGKTMEELFPAEFAVKITADDWAVVSRGEPLQLEEHLNGRSYVTMKFPITQGSSRRLAGFTIDVTERKRAEEEKVRLEIQLQQAHKMESVGRLAGGVAHDFNNMLGVILGHAELALRELDPSQPLWDDLQEIQRAAERSANLTRQLLAFARKQTIAPRVLDLNDAVEATLNMLRRMIGESIDLVWRPASEMWPVHADPSQIDQILANLCVNARDAIADVGKVTIETGTLTVDEACSRDHDESRPGDYVLLAVSDDGSGMDKDTLAKLFEPFFTTKELGQGTGLGLATVYGIVTQNGGFIEVDSEPGRGTSFRVYLPRYVGETEPEAPMDRVSGPVERGHETILLVEDEPGILKLTGRMLETQGYTVLSASTPGEALRLADEHAGAIHLLMTDVVMPEMNGLELARRLVNRHPSLRRLFMSGYTADVIAHRGMLDAGVRFIQKPFSAADLTAKVRDALSEP